MNMTSFSSQHDKHESSYTNNSAILSALGFGALGVLLFLLFRRRHSNSEDLCARPLEAKGKGAKSVERGGEVKRRGKGKKLPAQLTTKKFILLLDVEKDWFTACFGEDSAWPCELKTLDEDCSAKEASAALNDPNILCCVVQNDTHWNLVKSHYDKGGFVVYFGIVGEFSAPAKLNRTFGVQWRFSAYTAHDHELTSVGIQLLGDEVTEQQYTKSNMFSVPAEDRILIGKKYGTLEEYLYDNGFDTSVDFDNLDDEDREEYESARDVGYPQHCQEMENHSSLAIHVDPGHGGKIAYLGFVNGGGNIPKFVRALLTGKKTQK